MFRRTHATPQSEKLPLAKAASLLLEECRMTLPGVQALFGFQLIVVFNTGFRDELSRGEQELHLLAIVLIVVTMALIMTPAAYHRLTTPMVITERFIALCTRMLVWGLVPFAVAICLDVYLVARVIVGSPVVAWLAAALALVLGGLWFALPKLRSPER